MHAPAPSAQPLLSRLDPSDHHPFARPLYARRIDPLGLRLRTRLPPGACMCITMRHPFRRGVRRTEAARRPCVIGACSRASRVVFLPSRSRSRRLSARARALCAGDRECASLSAARCGPGEARHGDRPDRSLPRRATCRRRRLHRPSRAAARASRRWCAAAALGLPGGRVPLRGTTHSPSPWSAPDAPARACSCLPVPACAPPPQRHLECVLYNRDADGGSSGPIWKLLNQSGLGATALQVSVAAVKAGHVKQEEYDAILAAYKQNTPGLDPCSFGRIRSCTCEPAALPTSRVRAAPLVSLAISELAPTPPARSSLASQSLTFSPLLRTGSSPSASRRPSAAPLAAPPPGAKLSPSALTHPLPAPTPIHHSTQPALYPRPPLPPSQHGLPPLLPAANPRVVGAADGARGEPGGGGGGPRARGDARAVRRGLRGGGEDLRRGADGHAQVLRREDGRPEDGRLRAGEAEGDADAASAARGVRAPPDGDLRRAPVWRLSPRVCACCWLPIPDLARQDGRRGGLHLRRGRQGQPPPLPWCAHASPPIANTRPTCTAWLRQATSSG